MLQARLIGYAYDLDEQKGWTKFWIQQILM